MNLQKTLDDFTADLMASGKIPDAAMKGLLDGIREQVASGVADSALKAGDVAPRFTLKDADGTRVSSATLLKRGPLIVTFYRGHWCPYCNLELQAFEAARAQLEAQGASLVAISMQNATNSYKSACENSLGFPVLIDKGGEVAAKFGVRFTLTPKLIEIYKALGNDLERINGDSNWALPIPGRFVIAQDGIIAYAEVNADYTQRADPIHLLCVLKMLSAACSEEQASAPRSLPKRQPRETP